MSKFVAAAIASVALLATGAAAGQAQAAPSSNGKSSVTLASFGSSFGGGSIFSPKSKPEPPRAHHVTQIGKHCKAFTGFLRGVCARTLAHTPISH